MEKEIKVKFDVLNNIEEYNIHICIKNCLLPNKEKITNKLNSLNIKYDIYKFNDFYLISNEKIENKFIRLTLPDKRYQLVVDEKDYRHYKLVFYNGMNFEHIASAFVKLAPWDVFITGSI